MKRFKTKQELGNIIADSAFPFGEPASDVDLDNWLRRNFTDAPHPYERLDLKMKVTSKESEKVQKKAFKLGYYWYPDKQELYMTECKHLYIDRSMALGHGDMDDTFKNDTGVQLTPQQFLDGDVPLKYKITYEESDVPVKPDAYIKHAYTNHSIMVVTPDVPYGKTVAIELLYQYNIMCEDSFKAKYPEKLKFKDWDVELRGAIVHIGCEEFTKSDLVTFASVMHTLGKHKVSPYSFYAWLQKNTKKLGL